jgi:Baseplate J-like protein
MANKYVPQVDYTSRDYASIRDDMTALIADYAPGWTNRDPADFGMTLLELFSYMGDLLNYYIDRSANEAFIGTASQRDSVLQIAQLLGYKPVESTAATVTLTFQNSTGTPISVPALTRVATTVVSNSSTSQVIFETNSAISVPAKSGSTNGSQTVAATQGVTISGELIGTGTGQVNQVYKLSQTPVIKNSVSIVIGGVNYTQVPYLIDYNNYDPVFSVYTNAAGVSYVLFGDNISGRVAPNTQPIYATYRIGGGVIGNVATSTIKSIITNNVSGLSVLNSYVSPTDSGAASGGADAESTDSIRVNAPLSLRALNRAVSLSDYSALVKAAGVAKANAVADVYSSVTVYFAPYGDSGVQTDGVTASTVFNNLVPTIKTYLADKAPANTTVTFQPPSYVKADLTASVVVLPQYKQSLVKTAVLAAVSSLFAFDNVAFQDTIYLSDVMAAIKSVDGVASVQVQKLVRKDQDQTFAVTNKAITSNVATITTSVTHTITQGQTISVSGVGSGLGDFDGTYVVTGVTTNTISYANVYTNVSSTAVSPNGSVTALNVKDIVCAASEIPQLDVTSPYPNITYSGGITS